jgi:hypothetical protein
MASPRHYLHQSFAAPTELLLVLEGSTLACSVFYAIVSGFRLRKFGSGELVDLHVFAFPVPSLVSLGDSGLKRSGSMFAVLEQRVFNSIATIRTTGAQSI